MTNLSLNSDSKEFIRRKIESGQFPSEEAVIEAALANLREQDEELGPTPILDDLIDHEFVAYCEREGDEGVTLEEVLEATSKIDDSMARVIIEEERADRF